MGQGKGVRQRQAITTTPRKTVGQAVTKEHEGCYSGARRHDRSRVFVFIKKTNTKRMTLPQYLGDPGRYFEKKAHIWGIIVFSKRIERKVEGRRSEVRGRRSKVKGRSPKYGDKLNSKAGRKIRGGETDSRGVFNLPPGEWRQARQGPAPWWSGCEKGSDGHG
jgi:hypothetical protein